MIHFAFVALKGTIEQLLPHEEKHTEHERQVETWNMWKRQMDSTTRCSQPPSAGTRPKPAQNNEGKAGLGKKQHVFNELQIGPQNKQELPPDPFLSLPQRQRKTGSLFSDNWVPSGSIVGSIFAIMGAVGIWRNN